MAPYDFEPGTRPSATTSTARPAPARKGGVRLPKQREGYRVQSGSDSVFDYFSDLFSGAGYGDLGRVATRLARDARSPQEFMSELRKTPQYAQRFAGNIARQKAGLPMLSEDEYVAQESAYRQTLRMYGLPEGFYDSPDDFAGFIASDVSPQEIGARAKMASDLSTSKDPALINTLQNYFGLSNGDIAAYMLDPDRALPVLQRKYDTALVGAEADRAGLGAIDKKLSRQLADAGVDQGAARQAFGAVARDKGTVSKLADMDNHNKLAKKNQVRGVGVKNQAKAELGLDVDAAAKIRGLEGKERSRFRGSSGGAIGLGSAGPGSF